MAQNGWNEYKKLILHEIHENNTQLTKVVEMMGDMKEDIAALKVKAAIVGGAAGVVGTGIVTAILAAFK